MRHDRYQLRRHANGRWYATWSEHGRSYRTSMGTADYATARARLIAWAGAPPSSAPPTVAELLDAYLAERAHVPSHARLSRSARPLRAFFGRVLPQEITAELCAAYRAWRGRAATTMRLELQTLSSALHLAHRRGTIERLPQLELGPLPPPRARWLTPDEAAALLEACACPHTRLFVLLGLHTGARAQAILALSWDRVDFAAGLISYAEPGRMQTRKRRAVVPMNALVRESLVAARECARSEHVIEFAGRGLKRIGYSFREACRRAQLTGVSPHVLRHTCATWMAMAGVPLDQIADFLAAEPATVWRVYRKFQPGYLEDAAEALRKFAHIGGHNAQNPSIWRTREGG